MCGIRQIIHKLLASICHMGILLLFLGFLLECALSDMISLSPSLSHAHTHTCSVTVINHLHMCIYLIAPSASWRSKSSKTLFRKGTIHAVWVGCCYNGRIWKPLHCGPLLASHRKVGRWKRMLQPGQGKCMVEEATGWVGLTREHPVYRGGRENPKYLTNPPAEGDI